MKKARSQDYPPGWNEKKVLAVIAHYDRQTEEEAAAEIENAPETPGETWMSVPTELVEAVTLLIKDHTKPASPVRSRNHKATAPTRRARR